MTERDHIGTEEVGGWRPTDLGPQLRNAAYEQGPEFIGFVILGLFVIFAVGVMIWVVTELGWLVLAVPVFFVVAYVVGRLTYWLMSRWV